MILDTLWELKRGNVEAADGALQIRGLDHEVCLLYSSPKMPSYEYTQPSRVRTAVDDFPVGMSASRLEKGHRKSRKTCHSKPSAAATWGPHCDRAPSSSLTHVLRRQICFVLTSHLIPPLWRTRPRRHLPWQAMEGRPILSNGHQHLLRPNQLRKETGEECSIWRTNKNCWKTSVLIAKVTIAGNSSLFKTT